MGTIICGVDDSAGGVEALRVARDLSNSLEVRLVLAHVAAGYQAPGGAESLTTVQVRQGATRLLERLAREHGVNGVADQRVEVGEPAETLARIAAEEAATVIVVGARGQGRRRRKLVSGLAGELRGTAPCPVVIVPPTPRR
jgi:nucleotide-binding universal stress UspA family protein